MSASASIRIGVVLTMLATLMAVAPATAQAAPLTGMSCEAAGADIWAKSEAVRHARVREPRDRVGLRRDVRAARSRSRTP